MSGAMGRFPGGGGAKVKITINAADSIGPNPLPFFLKNLANLAAATDGNGDVLFGGGLQDNTTPVSDVVKYTTMGECITMAPLSVPRYSLAAATNSNGEVLFGGGNSGTGTTNTPSGVVEKYDVDGVSSILTPLLYKRYQISATTNGLGKVMFGGGAVSSSGYDNEVTVYDLDGTQTILALSGVKGRVGAAMNGLGKALFIGGLAQASAATHAVRVDVFDVDNTKVTLTMSYQRYYPGVATNGNGEVLVAGGNSSSGSSTNTIEKIALDDTITVLPVTLSYAKNNLGAATDGDGNVIFSGGQSGVSTGRYSTVDKILASDDSKVVLDPLPYGIDGQASATLGNGDVIFGGGTSGISTVSVGMMVFSYSPSNKKKVRIPAFNVFKFQENPIEQPAKNRDRMISVRVPNVGYIKQQSGTLTY